MEGTHTIGVYDDQTTGIARAGMRQTDLSAQLENSNRRKHRNKTQSVLYNGAMAKSKTSLFDGTSLLSDASSGNDYQQNTQVNQQMMMNQQMYNGYPQMQYNHQVYNNSNHSNSSFQQGYMNYPNQPQQGYYNQGNVYSNYSQQQQQQQQQYYQGVNQGYPNYQYNTQQQTIPVTKQRKAKKNYRESYMYLNSMDTSEDISQQPQVNLPQINGSPTQSLQRRFSAQNGGVMGSPMSTASDENTRKLTFPTIMGGMNHSSNMSDPDHTFHNSTANDWESIDEDEDEEVENEEEDEGEDYDDDDDESEYDNMTKADLQKILLSVKGENKSLKKKLKDIELGHDSNSIVANDEKYMKLEEEFSDLASKYLRIESEVENMTIQNESYFRDITELREKLQQSEATIGRFTNLSKSVIERIPTFVKQKDGFSSILGDSNDIPEQLKESYMRSLEKYQKEMKVENPSDGNLSDNDIMKMLKDEVRDLQAALTRSDHLVKHMEKIYNQKIQEERRTIIVSSLQKALHNEFATLHPNLNGRRGLRNLKIIDVCPSTMEPQEYFSPSIPNSASSPNLNINSSSSLSASLTPEGSQTRLPYLSPISPPSSSESSPKKRISLYSGESADNFKDAFSSIPQNNKSTTSVSTTIATSHNNTTPSLEIEYETFTS